MAPGRSFGNVAQMMVITVADEYPFQFGSEHQRYGVVVTVTDPGREHPVVSGTDGRSNVGKCEVAPEEHRR